MNTFVASLLAIVIWFCTASGFRHVGAPQKPGPAAIRGLCRKQGRSMLVAELKFNKLGGSDIVVSDVCLGTMTWGEQNTDEEAIAQLNTAWDEYGINFLDTAEGYPIPLKADTQGRTDKAIAKWMKSTSRPRDSVVIATKVCGRNDRFTWFRESGEGTRVCEKQIVESVESSLQRLQTDYLDVLQVHWPDRYVPLFGSVQYDSKHEREAISYEEQVEAMGKLIQSGKIRAWGLSNETPYGLTKFIQTAKAAGLPPPVSVQNSYSLLTRTDEMGLTEVVSAGNENIAYLPYSPLSAGVLSGKYIEQTSELGESAARQLFEYVDSMKDKDARLNLFNGYFDRYQSTSAPKAVLEYAKVALKHGLTPAELALAFCHSRSFCTSTIIGATSVNQLHANMRGFDVDFTEDMEKDIERVYLCYPDPWRMLVRDGG